MKTAEVNEAPRVRTPDWVAANLDGHDCCISLTMSTDEQCAPGALLAGLEALLLRFFASVELAYLSPAADGSKISYAEFRARGGSVAAVRALYPDREAVV